MKFITDAIRENSTLMKIYLGHNNIGNQGAEYIAEAIKENSSLQEIDLDSNDIGAK